jgi:hypothetical protein
MWPRTVKMARLTWLPRRELVILFLLVRASARLAGVGGAKRACALG